MENERAADILRGMGVFINPGGNSSPFVEALEAGTNALEQLEVVAKERNEAVTNAAMVRKALGNLLDEVCVGTGPDIGDVELKPGIHFEAFVTGQDALSTPPSAHLERIRNAAKAEENDYWVKEHGGGHPSGRHMRRAAELRGKSE